MDPRLPLDIHATENLIRGHCKNETITPDLLIINNGLETFQRYWRHSPKYLHLRKLKKNFSSIIKVLCEEMDVLDIFEFYYQFDHLDEQELKNILKLPKNEEDKKRLEEVREKVCRSWTSLRQHFDPKNFKAEFPTEYAEFCKLKC